MKPTPQSLVLVTIDCLRADHAGFMGYTAPTTPFLDTLAREAFVFENAIAAGSPTFYSLPAIMASRAPLLHGRDVLGIAPQESTIASVLKDSGLATAAFIAANPYPSRRFGYDQGFETFRDFLEPDDTKNASGLETTSIRSFANKRLAAAFHSVPMLGAAYDEMYFHYCQTVTSRSARDLDTMRRFPSADVIVDHAIAWLRENSRGPFFLWLHLMDPHAPYYPKQIAIEQLGNKIGPAEAQYLNSFWSRGDLGANRLQKKREQVIALYNAGIRWADAQIRRLCECLVDLNQWDKCGLAVTADHGEEFLDHGGRFHSPVKLTEELIHVPLLLRVPGHSASRVSHPFGIIDLGPTLLDIAGQMCPASFRGYSRWQKLQTREEWSVPVVSECVHACTNPFHAKNRLGPRWLAVRRGYHKLVIDFATGNDALFHLKDDPAERMPLPKESNPSVRRELFEYARKHVAESHKSLDFDYRLDSQLRELRLEWAHPSAITPN